MKRGILFSIATIIFVSAALTGGTGAFFSDIETSEGNTFTAGAIDLQIDNESYFNGEFRDDLSWAQKDLDGELFFNYADLRPGDEGEDTISLHPGGNDAWVCMDVTLTATDDNGLTDAESEVDNTAGPIGEGELQEHINFVWWPDDGDNVLEDDEAAGVVFSGTLADIDGLSLAFADTSGTAVFGNSPLAGSSTSYVGKAWCFGEITLDPLTQDGGDQGRNPADNDSGIECDGSGVGNESQSDSVVGTIEFRAVQSRHNPDFLCDLGSTTERIAFAPSDEDEMDEDNENELPEDELPEIPEEEPEESGMAILTIDARIALSGSSSPLSVDDFEFHVVGGTTTEMFDEVATLLPIGEYLVTQEYMGTSTFDFEPVFTGACSAATSTIDAIVVLESADDVVCEITYLET